MKSNASIYCLVSLIAIVAGQAKNEPPTTRYLNATFDNCIYDPCSLKEECCRFENWYDAGAD